MSYKLRIILEYFQPKIGRRIRIFSLGRKNNILIKKKECTVANLVSLTDVFVSSRSNPFVGEERCVTRQKWLGGRETMAT